VRQQLLLDVQPSQLHVELHPPQLAQAVAVRRARSALSNYETTRDV
jgi:hypothetical protein